MLLRIVMSVNHSNGNLFCDLSHFPSLTVLIQINRVVFALAGLVLDWLVPHLQINEAFDHRIETVSSLPGQVSV
jgi:hypothetical protein